MYLAAGPWYHGAWKKKGYAGLGPASFGPGSPEYFLREIEYPFFAFYLEGKGEPGARVRIMPSAETMPENASGHQWEAHDIWPPIDARRRSPGINGRRTTSGLRRAMSAACTSETGKN